MSGINLLSVGDTRPERRDPDAPWHDPEIILNPSYLFGINSKEYKSSESIEVGSKLGSKWGRSGVEVGFEVGLKWGRSGVEVGSKLARSGFA